MSQDFFAFNKLEGEKGPQVLMTGLASDQKVQIVLEMLVMPGSVQSIFLT